MKSNTQLHPSQVTQRWREKSLSLCPGRHSRWYGLKGVLLPAPWLLNTRAACAKFYKTPDPVDRGLYRWSAGCIYCKIHGRFCCGSQTSTWSSAISATNNIKLIYWQRARFTERTNTPWTTRAYVIIVIVIVIDNSCRKIDIRARCKFIQGTALIFINLNGKVASSIIPMCVCGNVFSDGVHQQWWTDDTECSLAPECFQRGIHAPRQYQAVDVKSRQPSWSTFSPQPEMSYCHGWCPCHAFFPRKSFSTENVGLIEAGISEINLW